VVATSGTPTGFSGVDPVESWPRTRSTPRVERLERTLDVLPGVGGTVSKRLAKLGLRSIADLLQHAPFRYERAAPEVRVADLFGEDEVALDVVVRSVRKRRARRLTIVTARVHDSSGEIDAVWFNQEWLADRLTPGTRLRLRGSLRRGDFVVRSYDVGDAATATADYAPVYPASEDVPPRRLRSWIAHALPFVRDFPDLLPDELKARHALPLRADALHALHLPRSEEEAEVGRRRLAFDELLELQLALALARRDREGAKAPALAAPGALLERYRATLPFTLTEYQQRAIDQIDHDLARSAPMQRLLQGDVGSGKTVVALYALLRAVERGYRGALMAPTETLAEQHYLTIEPICAALDVRVTLLTGSVKGEPNAQIVVGTHALIQEGVDLADVAVAVVDEQHRFGVEQRRALAEGRAAHVLHMTATPIPRTLALTLYGDLAVTEIARPPADRKPIVTRWLPQERSSDAYKRLRRLLEDGRQAYVVCPVIEESETRQARAAEAEAERLRRAELRGFRVGCLHGRLRTAERRELMARFKANEVDVLVATTVIEVGVDVPNATVMIVQEADRFGLAQLHQLRGRVGRGAEQSYCLLVSRSKDELTEQARARLEAMVETTDGFLLAERDLEIRGEGELLGTRQAGALGLRFASLRGDRDLLELARREADALAARGGLLADVVSARASEAAA
jgi:ATP-dependent DNA helicase RecG